MDGWTELTDVRDGPVAFLHHYLLPDGTEMRGPVLARAAG
ncbi:hypothetical protein B0E53_04851 [Micromonospora sp. MH33]|nr:hypothetical protein B0E53_04851 [Micromonospora sp. MH33]